MSKNLRINNFGKNKTSLLNHKLSISMIVRDEEKDIKPCIDSIIDIANEVVVVDTGSKDRTVRILEDLNSVYGKIKIFHFPWCDDFSAVRNFSKLNCKMDWILWFDADDRMHPDSAKIIKYILKDPYGSIQWGPSTIHIPDLIRDKKAFFSFQIKCAKAFEEYGETVSQSRMLPNNPNLRWEGPVHENFIESAKAALLKEVKFSTVTIWHTGYTDPEKQLKGAERNILLLKKGPETTLSLYHLSRCYQIKKDFDSALLYLLRVDPSVCSKELSDLIWSERAECLISLKRYDEAWTAATKSKKKDAIFIRAEIEFFRNNTDEATKLYEEYLNLPPYTDSFGTWRDHNRMNSYARLINIRAKQYYRLEGLVMQEYPNFKINKPSEEAIRALRGSSMAQPTQKEKLGLEIDVLYKNLRINSQQEDSQ